MFYEEDIFARTTDINITWQGKASTQIDGNALRKIKKKSPKLVFDFF